MRNSGASLNNVDLVINNKNYRKVITVVDIKPDQVILSIPDKLFVTLDKVSDTDLGKSIVELGMLNEVWQSYIIPVIYVLKEQEEEFSTANNWIKSFPADASDFPIFFDDEYKKILKGSNTLSNLLL